MSLLLGQTHWTFDLFTWNMKMAAALFSVTSRTSQWWKPSPWQNHSRKSIFNNWKLAIIAACTEISGSLSSAWGTGTPFSCLTGFRTRSHANTSHKYQVKCDVQVKKNVLCSSYFIRAVHHWNLLPDECREIPTSAQFVSFSYGSFMVSSQKTL